jgi:hemoglobin
MEGLLRREREELQEIGGALAERAGVDAGAVDGDFESSEEGDVERAVSIAGKNRGRSNPYDAVKRNDRKGESMRHRIAVTAIALLFVTSVVARAAEVPKKSLYDRLGGAYAIATVVDSFIEKLLVDDTLNANPAIREARARVPKAGLKFQVTALVCQVTGGPQTYNGRSMKEAHRHLGITEKEWDAMVHDFVATLDEFKVPKAEQSELLAIVGTTKGDIVAVPHTASR